MIIRTVTRALFAGYPSISVALVLLFCSSASSLLAQTSNWTNAGAGDWLNAANWDSGIPATNTEAIIDNGGTAQLLSATGFAEALVVGENATGSFLLGGTGRLTTTETLIGAMAGSTGTVTVQDNAIWTNVDIISIGTEGTGTLTTGQISKGAGSANAQLNGTIVLTGDQPDFFANFGSGENPINLTANDEGFGGLTFDTNGFNATIAAPLTGNGGLVKQGAGTLTLAGANSWQSSTIAAGGTLEIQNRLTQSSENSAFLVDEAAEARILNGAIVTTNSLFVLGQLVIQDGTMNVLSDANIGNVRDQGLVVLDGDAFFSASQIVVGQSGDSGIFQTTSTATPTVRTGRFSVIAGFQPGIPRPTELVLPSLRLEAAGNQSEFFNDFERVLANGELFFDTRGFEVSTNAAIQAETFTKRGEGILSLNGDTQVGSGFTVLEGQLTIGGTATDDLGAFVANDGTLIVNGTLNGLVFVDGILGGTGVVNGFVNVFNGTVSPGLSPGTLTIGGNLVLGPDATLLIEVEGLNPGEFDRVIPLIS